MILGSVRYSVNGGRVEYNSFNVDGGDVLNAGLNGNQSTLTVYPSLDALSEVQVLTSNYGAMYGQSASGTVIATTKSGTNQFHGVGYEFIRNEFFNARNYFDQTTKAPLYRRNDFRRCSGRPGLHPGAPTTRIKTRPISFSRRNFALNVLPPLSIRRFRHSQSARETSAIFAHSYCQDFRLILRAPPIPIVPPSAPIKIPVSRKHFRAIKCPSIPTPRPFSAPTSFQFLIRLRDATPLRGHASMRTFPPAPTGGKNCSVSITISTRR